MNIYEKIFLDNVYDSLSIEYNSVASFLFSKEMDIVDLQLCLKNKNVENKSMANIKSFITLETYTYYLSKDILQIANKVINYILSRYYRDLFIEGLDYNDFEIAMFICDSQDKKLFNFSISLEEYSITLNFLNGFYLNILVHDIDQFEIKQKSGYNTSNIEDFIYISYLRVIGELSKAWKKQNLDSNH